MSDHLLTAIQGGDARAFGQFVAGVEERLRLSLTSYAACVDVEAVVQETLIRVWQAAPRVQPDGGGDSLGRYAIRAARNLAIDHVRRQGRVLVEAGLASGAGGLGPEQAYEPAPPDPLLRQRILECRAKLGGAPSRAFAARMQAAGGQPDSVLAEQVGMRLNTFLKNFGRARKLLMECLRKAGVELEGLI